MTNESTGILFFEEYFDYMDDMTAEQYYQFMKLIRDVRFKGCDKDPSEIDDKTIRLAWRAIRPSVLKSARNARDYRKNKEKLSKADEPVATIQVEEAQTDTKPQTQEPQRVFGTQGEAIDYLVEYSKTHNKHDTEYERNKICRKYGFNYKSMIDEYMERRSMT